MPDIDDLTLIVGNRTLSGWESVNVTRGIEIIPGHFDVSMTERYPNASDFVVSPGDPCRVLLGGDTVITGYVDAYLPSFDDKTHTVRVLGRGKCQDIVDCSASWPSCQFMSSTVRKIAQELCKPYGIEVQGEQGILVPQYNFHISDNAYSIIETLCRCSSLLAYEIPSGDLLLSKVGNVLASGGVAEGVNIEKASFEQRVDHRYSIYQIDRISMNVFGELGDAWNQLATVTDAEIKRYRLLSFISEIGNFGVALAQKRGEWEMKRRFGRGYKLEITTDSWRDSAGLLWEPNTLVPISLPALKVPERLNWLLSEVTYQRDETGTHAKLTLMPPESFTVEPTLPNWVKGLGDIIPTH